MITVGKYQIFAEISSGPITTLYRAFDPQLKRIVLIKELNAAHVADHEIRQRFQQEGLITAQINHPNVVGIYSYNDYEAQPFIVMEFVEGVTLAEFIQEQKQIPADVCLLIMKSICSGICALHKKKYIHRDIKPANILISHEGNIKIGDFGFAEFSDVVHSQVLGTPEYLAPETVLSQQQDEKSDIFALGVVCYELLSGENPFRTPKTNTTFTRIANYNPTFIGSIRPDLPKEITELCQQMLHKDPGQRTGNIEQILATVSRYSKFVHDDMLLNYRNDPEHYTESPVQSSSDLDKASKSKRRKTGPVIIVSLIIALFLIILNLTNRLLKDETFDTRENTVLPPADIDSVVTSDSDSVEIDTLIPKEIKPVENKIVTDKTIVKTVRKDSAAERNTKTISIKIDTDPRSRIIIDGDSIGITPVTHNIKHRTGALKLTIQNPGFPLIEKEIELNKITGNEVRITLWDEVGYLDIASVNPWGQIWIDGDSIDVTPLMSPIILSTGQHLLEIKHPQCNDVNEKIFIVPGDTLVKSYVLLRSN